MKIFSMALSLSTFSLIFAMDDQLNLREALTSIILTKKKSDKKLRSSPRSESISRSNTPRLDVSSFSEGCSDGITSRTTSKSSWSEASPRSESPIRRRLASNESSPRNPDDKDSLLMPLFQSFTQQWEQKISSGSYEPDDYQDAIQELSGQLLAFGAKKLVKSVSSETVGYRDPYNTPITPDMSEQIISENQNTKYSSFNTIPESTFFDLKRNIASVPQLNIKPEVELEF